MTDIRVLIVDDSAVVRRAVANMVNEEPGMSVIGTAVNGVVALRKISELVPDVITLDLEMPLMGGLEVLSNLATRGNKIPVLIFSSLTETGSVSTLEALSRGAADYVCKPTTQGKPGQPRIDLRAELIPRLRELGMSKGGGSERSASRSVGRPIEPSADRANAGDGSGQSQPRTDRARLARTKPRPTEPNARPRPQPARAKARLTESNAQPRAKPAKPARTSSQPEPAVATSASDRLAQTIASPKAVVIGSSTGGPAALEVVLSAIRIPLNVPMFIVQHIPKEFSGMLAKRLNKASGMKVVEASAGEPVKAGTAYLAPGGSHMVLNKRDRRITISLNQGPLVNSCRPAVDVLFDSSADVFGARQVGVILTGMGQDGLVGCRKLHSLGVPIIAQDEQSCVVWGMPRFVTEQGLAQDVVPLDEVASRIIARVKGVGVNPGGSAHRMSRA